MATKRKSRPTRLTKLLNELQVAAKQGHWSNEFNRAAVELLKYANQRRA